MKRTFSSRLNRVKAAELRTIGILASLFTLFACISPQPKLYQTDDKPKPAPADTSKSALPPNLSRNKSESPVVPQAQTLEELQAQFTNGEIAVRILVHVGESYPALGQRILYHPEDWHLLPLPASSTTASYIEVPFAFLKRVYKKRALQQVFPQDTETDSSWVHVVTYAGETWSALADFFSEDVDFVDFLLQENGFEEEDDLRIGQVIKIPAHLLHESLRTHPLKIATPQPDLKPAPAPAQSLHSQDPELKLITKGGKTHGVYRLKRGEALYSAVVVRFTGRVDADEVNQIAQELLEANGLTDASKIPTGAEIKIPVELIDEAMLSAEPPEVALAPAPRRGRALHVILDAGHGGKDPGTMMRDLREAEVAFDLMRRIQEGLQDKGVHVHPLVSAHGKAEMSNGRTRNATRHEYVNTTPPYYIADGRLGLNLRIYLVDALYRKLLREGVAPENILFMSVHLDHLHPSVGGTMLYVPGANERANKFRAGEEIFDKYQESRNRTIHFNDQDNRTAESASWAFSHTVISTLRKAKLPVHAFKPVRKYVYRGGKKWTPGIIRYNRVPTAVLVEAANFSNSGDQKRIRSAQFRQQLANALVQAVVAGK